MSNVTPMTKSKSEPAGKSNRIAGITRIHLLGVMRVFDKDGRDILPRQKRTRAALAFLCLAHGEPVPRSRIAGVIWDRSGESQAKNSLRLALWQLERTGIWRIEKDSERVRLDILDFWIDAFEMPGQPDLLLDSLYGISPAFDHWLIGERVRFESRWQTTLEEELENLSIGNAPPELQATAARKLLNLLPTHEIAVRTLMKAFVDLDDSAQAIREYERFRVVVHQKLGIAPSGKTVALYEAIRIRSQVRPVRSATAIIENAEDAGTLPQEEPDPSTAEPEPVRASKLLASIAVLPFKNLSAISGNDHVCEGLVWDLVEALSRVPSFFVISRLSAAAFANETRSPQDIGAALGVRYLLSGSIRISGDRLRLSAELIETANGRPLWVSRLDEKCTDLLDLQSHLADVIARSVAPHLRSAELKRVRLKRTSDQGAYDLFLRGQESMHNPSRPVFESAAELFKAAVARQPRYATALAWLAHWHVLRIGQGWSSDPAFDTTQADHFASQAVECDPTEPMGFAVQGHVAAYLHKDFNLAFTSFDRALQLNANNPRAWLWKATAHAWLGEGALAVDAINRAMALSPYDPLMYTYSGGASMAYLADGMHARAVEFALRCMYENRAYTTAYKVLILALILSGRAAEVRGPVHQLLALEPEFTVSRFRQRSPVSAGPLCGVYCAAFAEAGVPLTN